MALDFSNLRKGAFTSWCKRHGFKGVTRECILAGKKSRNKRVRKMAVLAENFKYKFNRR